MAGPFIGEALASAIIGVAVEKVVSVIEYFKGRKLNDKLLQNLKIVMISTNAVLIDAEMKEITNPFVKDWLDEFKDAVYDAEDLLDEIATEELSCELEAESQTRKRKYSNFISEFVYPFDSFEKGLESELEKILHRLEYIAQQIDVLGLKKVNSGVLSPRLTTSCPEKCGVFGRDIDKEAIFKLWQSNDASSDGICVVPIVGMVGIGKTTLAQFIYNDTTVNESFDLKAWVCVSVNFDSFKILKTILEEVTFSTFDIQNLNLLQTKIREALIGKKFFLVLDDVWNENYNDWDELFKVFECGAQKIRIIVTTRSKNVALKVSTVPTHHCVKELSNDECWLLFSQHAFVDKNSYEFPHLVEIGKQIVKKCRGLPLAAKTVGGSLRSNQNIRHWNKILKNRIWDLPEVKSNILPALRLSYHCLPSHLKRCFAFCSIFSKDYEFEKEELIQLWMAEGLVQQPKEDRSIELEEIGGEYFDDLVSRSFFQPSNKNESCFVMHELISDLAKSISGKFCFRLENDESNEITKKTRHASYYKAKFDASKKFVIPYKAKGLRTFLGEEWLSSEWHDYNIIGKMIDDLFQAFKSLRVLSFSFCIGIKELPAFVGNLKRLRYLNIRGTQIKLLPDSLCGLYNLQTLILSPYITKLPTNMCQLINLRHLDNVGFRLKQMPPQMGKLKNLRKLSVFVVGKHGGSSIRELGELQHLSGKLSILNLENTHCTNNDTTKVMLKNKQDLSKLELKWQPGHDIDDLEKEINVLEKLCPHKNLKSLTIQYYEGTRFPEWLGDRLFSNMVSVKLYDCKHCFSLPSLGQLPALKKLKIQGFDAVLGVGPEFYQNNSSTTKSSFTSLEYLSFEYMPEWEEWFILGGEVFPRLQELSIYSCPKLSRHLPDHLPSLTKLEIISCKQLVSSLPRATALCELYCDGKIQFPSGHYYPSLERMTIKGGCDSLWSFPLELFPKLKSIEMHHCENLESLLASKGSHLDITSSLTYLEISECPNFIYFPSGGLWTQKLTKISVDGCKKFKSLPERMHIFLPSLVALRLSYCPELESFPKGGLPSNLKILEIFYSNKLISRRMEWGLQGLHSLTEFRIWSECEEVESFPEEALLPSTLITFEISSFQNLESLNNKGFQHLTSLKSLKIWSCNKLQCLPKEGFPSSLSKLEIKDCPSLKKWFKKEQGNDWLNISNIPSVQIM